MAKPKSRVVGLSDLRRKLRRTDDGVRDSVRDNVAKLARRTRDYARGHVAPVSSVIAAAISDRVQKDGMGATVGIQSSAAKRRAWYAHFVEWGTRPSRKTRHPGLPARPFLFPAWEQARAEFGPELRRSVNQVIERLSAGRSGD